MSKYPAIYKSVEGSEYLYQNKDNYYCYERKMWDLSEPHHDCHHTDKNITAEYLANTYGKVESPEHAEFIIEMCKVNGFEIHTPYAKGYGYCYFVIASGGLYFFGEARGKEVIKNMKQITIPMPPKRELKEAGHNLVFAGDATKWKPEAGRKAMTYDGSVCTVKCVEGDLAWCKFDGNELMINVHVNNLKEFKEVDKVKDWPQVGSEVDTESGLSVVKLLPDAQGYYVVETIQGEDAGLYMQYQIDDLTKPKTEDEILRDELVELTLSHMENKSHAIEANAYYLVSDLIEKYMKK